MTFSHPALLFASKNLATLQPPAVSWKVTDFSKVDDSVRGGSSKSSMQLVESKNPLQDGEIIFKGYLGK